MSEGSILPMPIWSLVTDMTSSALADGEKQASAIANRAAPAAGTSRRPRISGEKARSAENAVRGARANSEKRNCQSRPFTPLRKHDKEDIIFPSKLFRVLRETPL